MDLDAASETFHAFLARKQSEIGEAIAPLPGTPKRLSSGWAFHYQSLAYVETGEPGAMLVGHGAVVIRDDGRVIEGGSLDSDPETLLAR